MPSVIELCMIVTKINVWFSTLSWANYTEFLNNLLLKNMKQQKKNSMKSINKKN